jgi:hypothetical protein
MLKAKVFAYVIIFMMVGLSCAIPGESVETVAVIPSFAQAAIDMPRDNDSIPLVPYEIVYHGSDVTEVTQMELAVNSVPVSIQANPSPGTSFVIMRYLWTPPAPGTYIIQTRAQNQSGEWGPYSYVTVIVELSAGLSQTIPISPTSTTTIYKTPYPTQTSPVINIMGDGMFTSIVKSDDWFYYGPGNCQPREVDFTITIYKFYAIEYVFMFVRLDDKDGSGLTYWNDGKLMKETSSGTYITTIVLSDIPAYDSYPNAWLWYQFVIQKEDGGYIRSKVYTDISLYKCR